MNQPNGLAPARPGIELSVVVAASNHPTALTTCLRALLDQSDPDSVEIIVASNYRFRAEEFPAVQWIGCPAETTVPELRTAGIKQATGRIIALLEDNGWPDARWCAEIQQAHRQPYAAIGGAVEQTDQATPLDWAVFFFDYGKYLPPNQAGVVNALAGNNLSYKRAALAQVAEHFQVGFHETFLHAELQRRQEQLYLAPAALVWHNKHFALRPTLTQFYHLARSFAGRRVTNTPFLRRVALATGSLILPMLLPARIAANIKRKRRRGRELFFSFPYLVLLMSSWSMGELCGYLWGEGESGRRWK